MDPAALTQSQRDRVALARKKLIALAQLAMRPDLDPTGADGAAKLACKTVLRFERLFGLRLVLGGGAR